MIVVISDTENQLFFKLKYRFPDTETPLSVSRHFVNLSNFLFPDSYSRDTMSSHVSPTDYLSLTSCRILCEMFSACLSVRFILEPFLQVLARDLLSGTYGRLGSEIYVHGRVFVYSG